MKYFKYIIGPNELFHSCWLKGQFVLMSRQVELLYEFECILCK